MVHTLKVTSRSNSFVRYLFVMCWVTVALVLAMPANAQSITVPQLANRLAIDLKSQFGTTEQLNAAITRTYGEQLSPEKEEVARNTLRVLMSNDAVPMYLAKLLVPIYGPGITRKEVASAMAEGLAQMQVKGLARLSADRQAAFVTHMVSMTKAIPASVCKAMFGGRLDTNASAAIERRYIASLPLDRFEAITNLYKEAAEAELAEYPDARVINHSQAKLAEKVYEAASAKRLRAKLPQAVIQRVLQGVDSAPPSEVCSVMSESIAGMLDMSEPYRSWQLTRFTQSMQ